jgi:hypothetical protein
LHVLSSYSLPGEKIIISKHQSLDRVWMRASVCVLNCTENFCFKK